MIIWVNMHYLTLISVNGILVDQLESSKIQIKQESSP